MSEIRRTNEILHTFRRLGTVCMYVCMWIYIAQPLQPKQSRGASIGQTKQMSFQPAAELPIVSVESRSGSGRLFQSLGALEAKLRCPKVTVLVARTCKSPRAAERR